METGLLARYVTDPGIRMVTVVGRGGIGKTAMVCRLLKGLEAGRIPDVEGESRDHGGRDRVPEPQRRAPGGVPDLGRGLAAVAAGEEAQRLKASTRIRIARRRR